MRINWLPTKFSVLNFGKQSFKLVLVFFVTIVYLFILFLTKIFHLQTCKSAAWVSHKDPLWKDIELLVTEIYVSMFSETQNLFCFLPEMVKSSPKELFKIARCFRSYYWKLPKSHRKIQNDGNHPKPHTAILNTFGTQGTKMIQANIICSQILMLWSKPSFFWPRRILLFSLRTSLFDSQLLNGLWQWIIEIFIITQPYKLCTKRETKIEIALPRKITWLPYVNLCGIRSCLTRWVENYT